MALREHFRFLAPAPALVAALCLLGAPTRAALTDLVSLGSGAFSIDSFSSIGDYTQDASGTTFSPRVVLGDTVGGAFGPFDWSSFSDLSTHIYLKMSFAGANPVLPMTLELFNSDFSQNMKYQGTTASIESYPSYFKFDLVSLCLPSVLADVGGTQITWDGGATVNASLQAIASGPAPTPGVGGTFTARAPGGVRFLSSATNVASVELPPGAGTWSSLSDSNAKTDITAIDHRETLRKVSELPVKSWNYKHDSDRRYVGPMAQDFRAAFGLGFDSQHISTIDTDGVALSALKGLIEELQERKERSAAQAKRLQELQAELEALQKRVSLLPPAGQ